MNELLIASISFASAILVALITNGFLLRQNKTNATVEAFQAFYLSYARFTVDRSSPEARTSCLAHLLTLRMFVPENYESIVSRLYKLLLDEDSDKTEVGEAFSDVCKLGRKLVRRAYRILPKE